MYTEINPMLPSQLIHTVSGRPNISYFIGDKPEHKKIKEKIKSEKRALPQSENSDLTLPR